MGSDTVTPSFSTHGGDIYSRDIQYDFSANINPFGLPEGVKRALVENINRYQAYPDPECRELREAIAAREGVTTDTVVCGNGAADLIYRLVWSLKPHKALLPAPTFSEYERTLLSVNGDISHYFTREQDNFSLSGDFLKAIPGQDMVFLCSPNNPVGNCVDSGLLTHIVETCRRCGALLVLDQCFLDFVRDGARYAVSPSQNIVILKAFTKIYAMAGLRLGYLLCGDTALAEKVRRCGQCWSVSVPAQAAGVAALRETDYVTRTVELINQERDFLSASLRKFGFHVYPSQANFLLFGCELPLDKLLLRDKIAIRNCSDYIGLGRGYFRIAVRTHEENDILIQAIARCISDNG